MQMQINQIIRGNNPRTFFDPAEMAELENSIRVKGVIQPILVRPVGDKHQIVAGERRYRAATAAGLTEIPVLVKEMTDQEAEEAALIENIQRACMNPAEEAQSAAKILGWCSGDHDEAARRLGWSRSTLDKRLALMNCSEKVRKALIEREITLGHAELLAAVTKEKQDAVVGRLLTAPTLPTVAQLRSNLEQMAHSLDAAIFNKTGCAGCPHNSGTQQALFSEAIRGSNCTHGACYETKTTEALNLTAETLKEEFPVIKIVGPGDKFVVLALKAEGPTGVGEEQALACRGCANFGAAVSAIPDSLNKVYRHQCFDPVCNAKKVSARIAEDAAAAKAAEAEKAEAGDAKGKKPVGAAREAKVTGEKSVKTVKVAETSQRIKDYRLKIWRKAYSLEAQNKDDPERNTTLLLILAMTHNLGKVADDLLRKALGLLAGVSVPSMDVVGIGNILATADPQIRARLVVGIAASVSESIEENTLKTLLGFMGTDLRKYWKLNEEYLTLLTKSEIEEVCDKIGLRDALGEKFAKTMSGKKDEIIKGLLTVEGFDYAKTLPPNMHYSI